MCVRIARADIIADLWYDVYSAALALLRSLPAEWFANDAPVEPKVRAPVAIAPPPASTCSTPTAERIA